jgi:hypothetical protein
MDRELDDILNGSDEASVEAASAPTAAEAPAEAQTDGVAEGRTYNRDESGKFATKGEPQAAVESGTEDDAPPASEDESGPIPVAALKKERTRRQTAEEQRQAAEVRALAAEQQLQQLQARLQPQQPQQPPQAATQQPPDRWDDPEGHERWLVAQAAEAGRAEAMRAFEYQRIASSAQQFATDTPDYIEHIGVFEQMVNANPALLDQMHRAPNPAKFAYDTAKIQLEIAQHGGIEGVVEARVQAALRGQGTAAGAPSSQLPVTLADAQSASAAGIGHQPPSLEQLLR